MSARRALAALVLLVAAAPALAFVRETTSQGTPTGAGICLWWNTQNVAYQVNPSGYASSPGCTDAAAAATLARASFNAWAQTSCTDFHFTDALGGTNATQTTTGNDGVNLIIFRKGRCGSTGADPANCWEHSSGAGDLTIALTTTTFHPSTGEIVDADMELFGWTSGETGSPIGWWFTCNTGAPCANSLAVSPPFASGCSYVDVGTTVTHEAGHMLGLDHVCQFSSAPGLPSSECPPAVNADQIPSVMAATASPGLIHRSLFQDDVNGVCAIYPKGQAISPTSGCNATGTPSTGGSTGGGGGCGTGGAGELTLLAAAGLAARRWRRRRQETIAPA